MQQVLFFLFALIVGIMLPIQAALNTELGRAVKSPIYATLLSFIVGTVGLVIYLLATRADWTTLKDGIALPWYYWLGGILGALYVSAVVVLTPRLGVALTFGITIAGQMVFSVIMDHYGWLGVPASPINWTRVIGVTMIIAGCVLIRTT